MSPYYTTESIQITLPHHRVQSHLSLLHHRVQTHGNLLNRQIQSHLFIPYSKTESSHVTLLHGVIASQPIHVIVTKMWFSTLFHILQVLTCYCTATCLLNMLLSLIFIKIHKQAGNASVQRQKCAEVWFRIITRNVQQCTRLYLLRYYTIAVYQI